MQAQNQSYSQLTTRKQNPNKVQRSKILCNYYPLKLTRQIQKIYVFNIEMSPHITFEKLALRTRILSMLENQFSRVITKPVIAGLNIYSHSEPKVNDKMFQSGQYRIYVKLSKVVKVSQNPNLLVFIMDRIIRNLMIKKNYNIFCKSRKYFDMKKKVQHYAVNVYSGFHVDFVRAQSIYYLRLDSVRKIVCSQNALDAIQYYYKICRHRDRSERRKFIKQNMIGRTVMKNYGKQQFAKIEDVNFQCVQLKRMNDKPLVQYFEQKYGIEVKNMTQPLLIVKNNKKSNSNQKCYLVPELCFMVGLPQDIEELKERNILAAIKMQPDQIRNQTTLLMEDILQEVDEWKSLQKLGVVLQNKQMPLIECKKFPKPVLQLGHNLKVQRGLETFFNIACRPIYQGNRPVKCAILYFNRADINYLATILQKNSKDINVNIQFTKLDMGQLNNNKALAQVQMSISQACQNYKSNAVIIVLPNGLKTYYRKIKKLCLIDHKIVSQIICESLLPHRHSITIFGKLLLQILAKCGNILWIPKQTIQQDRKIMLLAYQTSKAGTQIAVSTCCTTDASYYVGYSKFGFANENSQRSAELLQVMIRNAVDCIQHYAQKNFQLPDQIILISKAGSISVAQSKFKTKFVEKLIKEIKQQFKGKKFSVTYILIQTKDSSKFFIHENPYTKARNAETGTVVDETIVKNNQFLLITQATPGVAANPIRFKILQSDSKLDRTVLQQLLFNQCFCYANFTGLVQTPAILQYAKKLAKFVPEAPFEEKLDKKIEQIPYYL